MVWDIQSARNDRERALCAYLMEQMDARAAPTASDTRERYRDVAHSVAIYCADELGRGLCFSELHALCSRALWGVGETGIARRMLDDHLARRSIRDTLHTLLPFQEVSPLLWRAVVRGVVRRHTKWVTTGGVPLWVLDLARLDATPCDLELARFMTVRTLLRAMTPVWMASSGKGVLAVRMRAAVHADVVGVTDLCRDVLDREKARRKWRAVPYVLYWR